jgi:DHA1 family bicyclomycin/chloramphenicol resistance-like MFS transporter
MERSASAYGLFFIVISLAFMLGNFVAGRISERVGVERMVVIGSSLAVLATLSCLLAITLFGWVPWALFGPCILLAIGNGFSVPNAMAGAISVEPRAAGAASGLAGFLQMLTAAVFAQLSGMWQNGTPFPLVFPGRLSRHRDLVPLRRRVSARRRSTAAVHGAIHGAIHGAPGNA